MSNAGGCPELTVLFQDPRATLATLYAVTASKIVRDFAVSEYVTLRELEKLTLYALLRLALPPASLQRFAV
jgi:hypothetical protein